MDRHLLFNSRMITLRRSFSILKNMDFIEFRGLAFLYRTAGLMAQRHLSLKGTEGNEVYVHLSFTYHDQVHVHL